MTSKQLRDSILQAAIQGQLVPQEPSDTPAALLLERIQAERESLIEERKIRRDKNASVIYRTDEGSYYERNLTSGEETCIDDEIPFDIPDSWQWTRVGQITDFNPRKRLASADIPPDMWVLGQEDIEKDSGRLLRKQYMSAVKSQSTRNLFYEGDILYGKLRPNLSKVIIADQAGCCSTEIVPLSIPTAMCTRYLYFFLLSSYFVSYAVSKTYGAKMPRVNAQDCNKAFFPIPPLEEQERIVARIEELMTLVDQNDQAKVALDELESTLPDMLQQSILQAAIQGQLVPQEPSDTPAALLLERIQAERERLIEERKIRRDKNASVIYRTDEGSYYERILASGEETCIDDEIPFGIPDSWQWTRLNEISIYIQRGKSPKYSSIEKYPVVAQKCNQWSGFSIEKAKFIDPNTLSKYTPERILQDEDLMWNSTGLGSLGRLAVYYKALNPYELAVADSHVTVIRVLKSFVHPLYLYFYLANPTVQSVIEDQSDGSTKQKELSTTTVCNYLIPIPPLEEQERIVARIEELMRYTDRLKSFTTPD